MPSRAQAAALGLAALMLVGCMDIAHRTPLGQNHYMRTVDGYNMLIAKDFSCGVDFIDPETGKRADFEPAAYGLSDQYVVVSDEDGQWWIVNRTERVTQSEAGPLSLDAATRYLAQVGDDWPRIRRTR